MRTALLLAALGLGASATAQIPLPVFGSTFTSTLTRGFWFQAPANFVITGLRVPNEALQPYQVVEVIDLGAAPPPAYPGLVTGTQLFYNNNQASGVVIPTSIAVAAGAYIGVLGACTSTVASNNSYNSYATPAGPFASNILGMPVTLTRFGTQFGIGAGGGNPCWQEVAGAISRVEVYVATATGTLATSTPIGQGCVRAYASFYEQFAPAACDLSNTTITWLNTGTGYTVVNAIPGTFVPPTPAAQVVAGGVLDGEQLFSLSAPMPISGGTTSALNVCTKGYIATAAGNGINFTPSASVMLGFPQTTWACWHDFDQSAAGSGDITFEEVGGIAYVTVNAVYTWLTTAPNTLQWQFDVVTGNVTLVFGAFAGTSYGTLVGYSPGGPNLDPGNTDISAILGAGAIVLSSPEVVPLALAATSRPVIGTSWNMTTSNIPATGVLGVDILGLSNPNIPDLSFLGMPTCGLFASLDVMNAYLVTGSTHAWSLSIPANPTLVNAHVYTSSAVFQVPPVNAFGAITSNGLDGRVGDV